MTILDACNFYGDFSELMKNVPWEPSADPRDTLTGIVVACPTVEEIELQDKNLDLIS